MTASRTPGRTLALICTAMFMLMLDLTIVAVALPDIQRSLDADLADLQWVVDAYTLPLAALLLTAATMGDRIGRRRIYLAGMAIFTIGSLACALAGNALALNASRASQGVGAAMLFGVAMPILGNAFPDPKARAKAIGAFGATLASATAVGPLLGGLIVDHVGWAWIFAINVPVGIVAFAGAWRWMAESRASVPRPADWWGTLALTVALTALVFAIIRGQAQGWGSATIVGALVVAALALAAFIARMATTKAPLVDLHLFTQHRFVGVGIAALVVAGTIVAATNYVGLYFVNTLGYTPFEAGARFLTLTVAAFVAAPITAQLMHRIPLAVSVPVSLALVAVGMGWASHVDAGSDWTATAPGFVLAGIGLGMSSAVLSAAALATVEPDRAGMATGLVNTLRQVGTATGVAICGALFTASASSHVHTSLDGVAPAGQVAAMADAVSSGAGVRIAQAAPPAQHDLVAQIARAATADAVHTLLLVGAVVAAIGAVGCLILLRGRFAQPGSERTERDSLARAAS